MINFYSHDVIAHRCVTLHHISLLMNFIDNVDGNFE